MRSRLLGLTLCGLLGAASPLLAQGYGVYEQGACAAGRGGAGVADPCADGSSIFFNPAGLAFETDRLVSGGVSIISPRGAFVDDRSGLESRLRDKNYVAPSVYYRQNIGNRLAAGIGLFAPYGLTTDWPAESQGRFLGYKSLVQAIYLQPTVAYRVNDRLAVGGGVDITFLDVELRRRLDLSRQPLPLAPSTTFGGLGIPEGTDFADLRLTGDALHAGFHLGVLVKPHPRLSLGARFLAGQKVGIDDGELETRQIATGLRTPVPLPGIPAGTPLDAIVAPAFSASGPLASGQRASTDLPLPAQFVVGGAIQVTTPLRWLIDYQFTNWSAFDVLTIDNERAPSLVMVERFRDSHGLRTGVEYELSERTTLRGGLVVNSAAAPDETVTPNLPEATRVQLTAGIGQRLGPSLRLDAYYLHLFQDDRRGRTTDAGLDIPTTQINNGVYSFHANLFGASLVFTF